VEREKEAKRDDAAPRFPLPLLSAPSLLSLLWLWIRAGGRERREKEDEERIIIVLSGRNHVHSRIYIGQTNTHTLRPRIHHARDIHFLCARVYMCVRARARVWWVRKNKLFYTYITLLWYLHFKENSFGIQYVCINTQLIATSFT